MRLPGARWAIIEPAKIRDYLLNPDHPVGCSKAELFLLMGFRRGDWAWLAASMRRQILDTDAVLVAETAYGQKFTVTGPLYGINGQFRVVTTVWIIDAGSDVPRLVTAYSGEKA